jgi:hypothetical protein
MSATLNGPPDNLIQMLEDRHVRVIARLADQLNTAWMNVIEVFIADHLVDREQDR